MSEFNAVEIGFGYKKPFEIFENLNLTIKGGDIVIIQGSNGTGKSTLLKILAGLLDFHGTLFWEGHKLTDVKEYKKRIAYIPDSPLLYNILSGKENLSLIEHLWEVEDSFSYWGNVQKLSEEFGMDKVIDQSVEEYSLGMRNKLFFIASLARNPELVFLDEPFSSWDVDSQKKVVAELKEYVKNKDKSVVIVTHSEKLIDDLEGRILLLKNKKLENPSAEDRH